MDIRRQALFVCLAFVVTRTTAARPNGTVTENADCGTGRAFYSLKYTSSTANVLWAIIYSQTAQNPVPVPSASSSASSSGGSADGNANLSNQALAGFSTNNGPFQALATSQNSANGNSKNTIYGSTSISANTGTSDYNQNGAYIQATSNGNSYGNGLTGTIQNLDKTNSSGGINGGGNGLGTSQISGTGTGMSISSNTNAQANAWPPVTTARPACYSVPCCGCACYCPSQCSMCQGYSDSCPAVTAVLASGPPKSSKTATINTKSKTHERLAAGKPLIKKYLPVLRHEQRGVTREKRSVLFANRC